MPPLRTAGRGSEETIRSLARKLEAYAAALPEGERALLEHLLLTALPPLERRARFPGADSVSDEDAALLDRLAREA